MKLSIVIVNYNVKYFLELCLLSVQRAIAGLHTEVFVVDNASSDGSVAFLKEKFDWVKTIANTTNVGFSCANNQAVKLATGQYILLLNPDTVVAEDTFIKCLTFMDANTEAGALGVRMIDGKGNFLPESKRGLPTPAVAFYKTFGLASIFPASKTFGRYHLGFLPEKQNHEVEILSGAYMFMRKAALQKTGLLDETFFMYGEDIDLSYRILKAGFKNYYFADTTIIHYKGESTKKGSLNYVKVFYNAMLIFARKHFSQNQSGLFSLLINFAIVLRGLLTLLASIFASSYLFIIDALLSFGGIYYIKNYWQDMIKYSENYYPNQFLFIVVPSYISIWIIAAFFSGAYDKPFRLSAIVRGIILGTVSIAVLYAFIPDQWRFSRAIILLGATFTGLEMMFTRTLYHLIKHQSLNVDSVDESRSLIVGKGDAQRAHSILQTLGNSKEIAVENELLQTKKMLAIYGSTEIIFCAADYSFSHIIQQIETCGTHIHYKILNKGSTALIGSNSKDGAGDLYLAEKSFALFKPQNIRSKRLFDFTVSLALLLLLPLHLFLINNKGNFILNAWQVLIGKKSWVGFETEKNKKQFPLMLQGILHPSGLLQQFTLTEPDKVAAELNYAQHYSVVTDVLLIIKNYSMLGK